ncbi:hypothetical protein BDY21DRAFT_94283 [Lineolata rhizophorae]|uniref:J domain-containing protein n=1 Tax=Lineolata rhizophorae TaxID=578093 RepID=A0A6A6NTE1_9PEZI|nr:hypothetical protein BDY21DRAFT_94283 [Lineolata rhizophorae]
MRRPAGVLAAWLLLLWAALVAAWTKEDHEIFRLRDEVAASEGPSVTFYDFLGVSPSASQDAINKAYRKKSRLIHPDKAVQAYITTYDAAAASGRASRPAKGAAPTVRKKPTQKEIAAFSREANARFARLGVVAAVLRGPDRSRYDHFLAHGFPAWRGTGYYYARYRPGLAAVAVGLFVALGGPAHHAAQVLAWRRRRDFVLRYVRHARRAAWGDELGIPGLDALGPRAPPAADAPGLDAAAAASGAALAQDDPGAGRNRKEKRRLERENKKKAAKEKGGGAGNAGAAKGRTAAAAAAAAATAGGISEPVDANLTSGPRGAKKRVVAENGKVLVVDSVGNVYLEEETEEGETHEYLLDVDEIPKPTFRDTALVRLPVWLFRKSVGRFVGVGTDPQESDLPPELEQDENGEVTLLDAATADNPNGEARKRKPKVRGK